MSLIRRVDRQAGEPDDAKRGRHFADRGNRTDERLFQARLGVVALQHNLDRGFVTLHTEGLICGGDALGPAAAQVGVGGRR